MGPTEGRLRLLRGVAVASVSTLLTAAGHVAAGGAVPDAGLLVVLGLLLAGVLVGFADRQASVRGVLAALAGAQLATHVLLELLGRHPHGAVPDAGSPLAMLAAHVAATLVTAWLLYGADRAIFVVAAAIRRALPRRFLPPLPVTRPRIVHPLVEPSALLEALFRTAWSQRGPPALS